MGWTLIFTTHPLRLLGILTYRFKNTVSCLGITSASSIFNWSLGLVTTALKKKQNWDDVEKKEKYSRYTGILPVWHEPHVHTSILLHSLFPRSTRKTEDAIQSEHSYRPTSIDGEHSSWLWAHSWRCGSQCFMPRSTPTPFRQLMSELPVPILY